MRPFQIIVAIIMQVEYQDTLYVNQEQDKVSNDTIARSVDESKEVDEVYII